MENNLLSSLSAWEFRSILDSISDAVFIDDSNGYAIWCNKACESLYEISNDDVNGMHVSELEREGIFSPSVATIVLAEKREATIIHENRSGRKLLSTGMPILDEKGNITKIITTSRDISELSLLQDRLQTYDPPAADMQDEDLNDRSIIARSDSMVNVLRLAQRLATVDSTVLITGESGVGKGVIASFLHMNGNRKDEPMVTVNCGAIPANLIESELFGYEKGAFTGARAEGKKGFFEVAQNGTIFLDEISELPLDLQVKLLQVIQERFITRVGGTDRIPVNVRIISATNRKLKDQVDKGLFREDLYYRLNVVPLNVPPLRKRQEDMIPLLQLFLKRYNKKYSQNKSITKKAMDVLAGFQWPGNIRELQNIVERLILTSAGDLIDVDSIPEFIIEASSGDNLTDDPDASLSEVMEKTEKKFLEKASGRYPTTRAMAKALKTSQPTIVRKLHKYGISLK